MKTNTARTAFVLTLLIALPAIWGPTQLAAQDQYQFETELTARRRIFPSVGGGFRELRRGPAGTYYVLTAPAPLLFIYDTGGKRIGQIPADPDSKDAALISGNSFDVDRNGIVVVSDSASNFIKVYGTDGDLRSAFPVPEAVSVAILGTDAIAVATPKSNKLVTVYNFAGKVMRDFGDPEDVSDVPEINRLGNSGHLLSDPAGNAYFAFDRLPEPTVRKFDPTGHLSLEIALTTLEFQGAAQSARRAIVRSESDLPKIPPVLHRIITAIGVDPESQEVWLAIGTLLMEFDKDGRRVASFRTYTPKGERLEGTSILVEPTRLLIGADPDGIYEFARPARISQ